MTRATGKSILVILVTFAMFLTQGWGQETIKRNEREINWLFEQIEVFGQIVPGTPLPLNREEGNVIKRQTIDEIITSDLVQNIYFEAETPWSMLTREDEDRVILNETLETLAGSGNTFEAWNHRNSLNTLIAIEQLSLFIERHTSVTTTPVPGVELEANNIDIEFALGFDQTSFVYSDESLETPIPVILSEEEMMNGYELGEIVSIGYDLNDDKDSWQQMTAVIIGYHHGTTMSQTILLPLSAWELVQGENLGFTTLEFIIDPKLNREISAVEEKIEEILTQSGAGFGSLMLELKDEELRFVVQPVEETLSLLWLLYPVVILASMLIATGLSFFLTLQNAKNVAVMRTFGATRKRIALILGIEQIMLCLIGKILGLCLLISVGWGFGILELLGIAGLYLLGVMIGSAIGIFIITRHAPLELLQVKE